MMFWAFTIIFFYCELGTDSWPAHAHPPVLKGLLAHQLLAFWLGYRLYTLIFNPFLISFLYCELGEMIKNEFNIFNEELCQCKWYLFSIDVQRMILIFMSDAQQPMLLRGYGNIVCTRNSFKNVIFFRIQNFSIKF